MTSFNEIKIIGMDANRPPRIRKESYIDLFYRLSEEAPEGWCEDFDAFGRQLSPTAKIDTADRGIISTYVNDMDTIPGHFAQLKQAVADCNREYLEKLRQMELAMAKDSADLREQGGEQFKLNQIIASLDFDA
jgi:hypothetical protein